MALTSAQSRVYSVRLARTNLLGGSDSETKKERKTSVQYFLDRIIWPVFLTQILNRYRPFLPLNARLATLVTGGTT